MIKNDSNETKGLRERTHESVDMVIDKAEDMNQSGKKTMAHVKEKAKMMGIKVDEYIKTNPKKTVMFAAGTGAVLGAVAVAAFMRKKRKNQPLN
ncbi:hypothetical protein COT47_03500 [Candidatus Woesearchaeota archaeon CG08_land_8_20_14_0_20_43_7]|nr:MAG: hypothetical protein COT47_03500 [Candidatus Woesearchaeota archaeon CG08_land_8_20_14_0_20_43_7]